MIEYNDPTTERNKPQKNIVLIGNGFDIRTFGEDRSTPKTTFKDFIMYVIYGCILHNYDNNPDLNHHIRAISSSIASLRKQNNYPRQLDLLLSKKVNNYKNLCKNPKLCKKCRNFIDSKLGTVIVKNIIPSFYEYLIINNGDDSKEYNELIDNDDSKAIEKYHWKLTKILINYGIWTNFADSYHISNEELQDYYNNHPQKIFNRGIKTVVEQINRNIDNKINLWLDVESVIELIITSTSKEIHKTTDALRAKYNFHEEIPKDYNSINKLSDGLNLLEELLHQYLKETEKHVLKNASKNNVQKFFDDIKESFSEPLRKRSLQRIKSVSITDPDVVINYNYTDIADRYYSVYSSGQKPDIRYINGALTVHNNLMVDEINTNIVIGYSNINKIPLSKELFPFEKSSRRIIKNTCVYPEQFIQETFDLIIIGHSCGIADGDVIKKLLDSDNLNTAVILCHELQDLISCHNNVKEILGDDKFSKLVDYSQIKGSKLYFSVEKSKFK